MSGSANTVEGAAKPSLNLGVVGATGRNVTVRVKRIRRKGKVKIPPSAPFPEIRSSPTTPWEFHASLVQFCFAIAKSYYI